jgi:hypothetical protein
VRGNGNYKKRVRNYFKRKQAIVVMGGKEISAFVHLN